MSITIQGDDGIVVVIDGGGLNVQVGVGLPVHGNELHSPDMAERDMSNVEEIDGGTFDDT